MGAGAWRPGVLLTVINKWIDLEELRLSCRECSIQELCLPATLRGNDLVRLNDLLGHSDYRRGQHIFNTAEPCEALYVIRSGAVKTWVTSLNGSMQILGFQLPGEIVGLDGLAEHHFHCSAEVMEPTRVCRLPLATLERTANEVPALQKQLMRIISREFVLEQEHIVMMGARPALERLALFIQTLSQRRELLGEDRYSMDLPMSRVDLGNYLALATETVSRLLARLQRLGVIELGRHHLRILDMERLVEISGEDLGLIRYPD